MLRNITEKKFQKNNGKNSQYLKKNIWTIKYLNQHIFKTFLVHLIALEGKNKHAYSLTTFFARFLKLTLYIPINTAT